MNPYVVFGGTFLSAVALVRVTGRIALRAGMLDVPNARSSHLRPTPRGGGLAIVIVTLLLAAAGIATGELDFRTGLAWLAGGAVVATAGLLDDLRGLSPASRLGFHFLAAAILLAAAGGLPPLPWPGGPIHLGPFGWLIGALVIVWSINLFNFMDGIDGLAAMQAVFVVGSATALRAADVLDQPQLVALVGATAGFLVWNFPPARIFMGDAGSGFLGYALAAGALLPVQHDVLTPWTWFVLNGLFFADATVTLMTRLLRGQRVYEAHRLHLYQHLARRWQSHQKVTLLALAANVMWCLPWAVATVYWPSNGPLLALAAVAPLCLIAASGGAGAGVNESTNP